MLRSNPTERGIQLGLPCGMAHGAPPLEVDFENESQNATQYLWNFSQNNDDQSTNENASYIYQNIGTLSILPALNYQYRRECLIKNLFVFITKY